MSRSPELFADESLAKSLVANLGRVGHSRSAMAAYPGNSSGDEAAFNGHFVRRPTRAVPGKLTETALQRRRQESEPITPAHVRVEDVGQRRVHCSDGNMRQGDSWDGDDEIEGGEFEDDDSEQIEAADDLVDGKRDATSTDEIIRELAQIREDLAQEATRLRQKEEMLTFRESCVAELEQLAIQSQELLVNCAEREVNQRWASLEQARQSQSQQLIRLLKAKEQENLRLQQSFEVMKNANHLLKEQVGQLEEQNRLFSKQLSAAQRRLANLQKLQQVQHRPTTADLLSQHNIGPPRQSTRGKPKLASRRNESSDEHSPLVLHFREPLCALLDWVVGSQPFASDSCQGRIVEDCEVLQGRCARLVPVISELITSVDCADDDHTLVSALRFTLWSALCVHRCEAPVSLQSQRTALLMVYRRIGEDLGKRRHPKGSCLHSSNWHVCFLSALVILRTVSQTEVLLQAFDVLRNNLKEKLAKRLFLDYSGISIIQLFLRPSTNKALLSAAVDVHLHLVTDKDVLPRLLSTCSTDTWFHSTALLLRRSQDAVLCEKMSIVLQKLSAAKMAHSLFVTHQLVAIAEQLIHRFGTDNTFLTLNLRSVINNIAGGTVHYKKKFM